MPCVSQQTDHGKPVWEYHCLSHRLSRLKNLCPTTHRRHGEEELDLIMTTIKNTCSELRWLPVEGPRDMTSWLGTAHDVVDDTDSVIVCQQLIDRISEVLDTQTLQANWKGLISDLKRSYRMFDVWHQVERTIQKSEAVFGAFDRFENSLNSFFEKDKSRHISSPESKSLAKSMIDHLIAFHDRLDELGRVRYVTDRNHPLLTMINQNETDNNETSGNETHEPEQELDQEAYAEDEPVLHRQDFLPLLTTLHGTDRFWKMLIPQVSNLQAECQTLEYDTALNHSILLDDI